MITREQLKELQSHFGEAISFIDCVLDRKFPLPHNIEFVESTLGGQFTSIEKVDGVANTDGNSIVQYIFSVDPTWRNESPEFYMIEMYQSSYGRSEAYWEIIPVQPKMVRSWSRNGPVIHGY